MTRRASRREGGDHRVASFRSWLPVLLVTTALPVLLVRPATAVETETFEFAPSPLEVQGHERRTFSFDLDPGDAATDAVRVTNKTDEQRRFRLYPADAGPDPETGATAVGAATDEPQGVGSWIELDRTDLTLAGGESTIVPFTIARPADSTAEGLGALVAEEILEDEAGGGISVVYRLAMLVRLGGDVAGLDVGTPTMTVPVQFIPSTAELSVELTNGSLQPARATVAFTATGLTGRVWHIGEQDVRIAPGEAQRVAVPWSTVPRWGGMFRPAVSMSWQGGSIVRTGAASLHPPLWLIVIAIIATAVQAVRELRRELRHPNAPSRKPSFEAP